MKGALREKERYRVCRQIVFPRHSTYILIGRAEMYLALLSLCSQCCRPDPPQGWMNPFYYAAFQLLRRPRYRVCAAMEGKDIKLNSAQVKG